jgi:glycosyltransferase involved in cell wall biosynthesis
VLAIIGPDDGYKPELDRLITGLGLNGKVLYTGYLSGDDKLSALEDAGVVIQTSRYEQGAWAPLEAVLCGTPIIVSSNSGAGEDVRRIDAGYLVEYGDKGQLSDAIKYVFDNPAEARAKTLRAKKYIEENLSMKSGIAKYEKVYQEVMGAKK